MSAYKTETLHRGPCDGRKVVVPSWQEVIYVPVALTVPEHEALQIDEVVAWKGPEAVYYRDDTSGEFRYDRTVHYKP